MNRNQTIEENPSNQFPDSFGQFHSHTPSQNLSGSRTTIALLFGGCSTEYHVSLQSAYSVFLQIDTSRYSVFLIGLHPQTGQWYWYRGNPERILHGEWCVEEFCVPVFPTTDRSIHGVQYVKDHSVRSISFDAALPILHGKNGEDGTVQGLLELAGIPIIGCDLLSSALCMNKELAHRLIAAEGIATPKSILIQPAFDKEQLMQDIQTLGYPIFVKPVRSGSSFGITKVLAEQELLPAIKRAFVHDSHVLLEETIPGFEVGCAILGTNPLTIGAVDEIELSQGFFDYTEKYTLETAKIHVPARISDKKAKEIQETAKQIYTILGCKGFARVDLFLTPEGKIVFNEVNTIPGFTPHSRYPNMLKAAGWTFSEVIHQLLKMGECI